MSYVLITAAKNEERCIEHCIQSLLRQSILPLRWIIVSDGSTDKTDAIVKKYEEQYDFLTLVRRENQNGYKGFASKVMALKVGFEHLDTIDYDFIGHLDADITFPGDYYGSILKKFDENKKLGLTGGFLLEPSNGVFKDRPCNTAVSIAGGIQLFRKKCYEDMGGLKPIPFGGEDWYCEIKSRMKGWEVMAFSDVTAHHHKTGRYRRGMLHEALRGGTIDYCMGTHPLFLLVKCLRRLKVQPFLLFSFLWFFGFLKSWVMNREHYVEDAVRAYLKREQLKRLRLYFMKG